MIAYVNSLSLLLIYFSVCILIYILALLLKKKDAYVYPNLLIRRKKSKINDAKHKKNFVPRRLNILFVIAHPDDECMFFGPSLVNAVGSRTHTNVSLLCLSAGDYFGLGEKRQKELFQSCEVFGIHWKDVKIVDHSDLQDDPAVFWDVNLVAKEVLKVVKSKQINQIVTFDCHGASGHKNHISVYRGVRHLVTAHLLPKGTRVSSLETVSFFRHYISFLDIPFSLMAAAFGGNRVVLSSPLQVWTSQISCSEHSQTNQQELSNLRKRFPDSMKKSYHDVMPKHAVPGDVWER